MKAICHLLPSSKKFLPGRIITTSIGREHPHKVPTHHLGILVGISWPVVVGSI